MADIIDFDFYRRFKVALPARPSTIARALRVERERRALWLKSYRRQCPKLQPIYENEDKVGR